MDEFTEQELAEAEAELARRRKEQGESTVIKNNSDLETKFEELYKKKKGLYQFIQQNKPRLLNIYSDKPDRLNLITLVPSVAEEVTGLPAQEINERNKAIKKTGRFSKEEKVKAAPQDIADIREAEDPYKTKLLGEPDGFDKYVKNELSESGYDVSEEDAKVIADQYRKEQDMRNTADRYENWPWYAKAAGAFVLPRVTESYAAGRPWTWKDAGLDAAELVASIAGPGLIGKGIRGVASAPKIARILSRGAEAAEVADKSTKGAKGLNFVGDIAGKVGTAGAGNAIPQIAADVADNIAYDDAWRERSDRSVGDIGERAMLTGTVGGILGGSTRAKYTPEQQKILGDARKKLVNDFSFSKNQKAIATYPNSFMNELAQYVKLTGQAGDENVLVNMTKNVDYKDVERYAKAANVDKITALLTLNKDLANRTGDFNKLVDTKVAENMLNEYIADNYVKNIGKMGWMSPVTTTVTKRGRGTWELLNGADERGWKDDYKKEHEE